MAVLNTQTPEIPYESDSSLKSNEQWESKPILRKNVKQKLKVLSGCIDTMTDDAFGEWVDSLSFGEFLEFIDLTSS